MHETDEAHQADEADEVDDELSREMEEDVDRDRSRTSCMRLSRRLCAICFSNLVSVRALALLNRVLH
jgi:hypothetical protein